MVKEKQSSIEGTSHGQMRNILAYGHYRVGTMSKTTVHSINSIIHVHLQLNPDECDETSQKDTYTYDELQNVGSKLVLVSGGGKETKQYLNVSY